jgi:hypothetical protein
MTAAAVVEGRCAVLLPDDEGGGDACVVAGLRDASSPGDRLYGLLTRRRHVEYGVCMSIWRKHSVLESASLRGDNLDSCCRFMLNQLRRQSFMLVRNQLSPPSHPYHATRSLERSICTHDTTRHELNMIPLLTKEIGDMRLLLSV